MKTPTILDEVMDPLLPSCYYGKSASLISELEYRLPHRGPIFKNDNATVHVKIEEDALRTSVESTIKSFSRLKHGRGAFQALIINHAGDVKHRSISKKRFNFLQNMKWNEIHVSIHRKAHDNLLECSVHIECAVPGP